MPINPGKDDDGNVIDYGSTSMNAVWDEIEEAGLPVTHHIGETPPKTPCEFNSVVVGMMINIDGFREVFSKYIFSGILDRHPEAADRLVRGRDRLGAMGVCRTPSTCSRRISTCSTTSSNTTSSTTGTPT